MGTVTPQAPTFPPNRVVHHGGLPVWVQFLLDGLLAELREHW